MAIPEAVNVDKFVFCVTPNVPAIKVLPVGPSTVKFPAPTFKSSPINVFLATAKPPAVRTEAFTSVADPESAVFVALNNP